MDDSSKKHWKLNYEKDSDWAKRSTSSIVYSSKRNQQISEDEEFLGFYVLEKVHLDLRLNLITFKIF